VHPCIPVHVFVADFTLVIAVSTYAVDDAFVELLPAVFIGTIIEFENVLVGPLHVLVSDFKLVIAVFTKAVDAALVEFSDDVFVNTDKS